MRGLTVALVGNPNCGKTTLFNRLTGARQHVGNWPGVTVERKEGRFDTPEHSVRLVDLPGTYALTSLSEQVSLDEQIACQYLAENDADLLINVVDATNLERHLYLTLQLLESGLPCIVALNMLDLARQQHIHIDIPALAARLDCPVIGLVSTSGEGLAALKLAIDAATQVPRPPLRYAPRIEEAVSELQQSMPATLPPARSRGLALRLLEGDRLCRTQTGDAANWQQSAREQLHQQLGEEPALLLADARYQAIAELCSPLCDRSEARPHRLTVWLDHLVLNRWLGIPLFLLVMYLMFFFAINVGGALQPLFDEGSAAVFIQGTQWLGQHLGLPAGLTLFLAQGVGGGINTVLPLIPQIGLMFLFLALLEDSGYMARAAFVMDRLMRAIGLPGKAFVPLIVGFGCNVPSIMGARTLDSPRERLTTILMAPFMSCGARLAIFAVFAAAFFGRHGALAIFSLYLLGILVAVLTGLMLKHTLLRGEASPFVMELPQYHLPHPRNLLVQSWARLRDFVLRAGKVIVVASIVIGALNSFTLAGQPIEGRVEQSALATLSHQVTPLLAPMGVAPDNWQATVGLVSGAMAKEVVVGTLNTLYTADRLTSQPFDAANFDLLGELRQAAQNSWNGLRSSFSLGVLGNPLQASAADASMDVSAMSTMATQFGSPLSAYSYLVFVLLYVPCASALGAIARESSSRWMLFSMGWGTCIAYSLATLCYQALSFGQHPAQSALAIAVVLTFNAALVVGLRLYASLGGKVSAPQPASLEPAHSGGCH
ncbi:Fe(2+) transporter permease subunit FeoB [Pseudomonas sp. LS44]|uniref:Fe(2+) transporter permease subunit FeoB n=1 Tax=Pseudomonas sp. LS44 TaxID=1357074 RepID=UPI00215B57B7|nr:Fe(2+) transporter permease subunit FeoB [Pseudomonas sp. LS44]UVE18446.1 Fe(2+) transporter permease subunit FeoB [Pseudomonas sp. LS44]